MSCLKSLITLILINQFILTKGSILIHKIKSSEKNSTITCNPYNDSFIRTLKGHTGGVVSLTVLPNGDLASGSYDNSIIIWNPNDFCN